MDTYDENVIFSCHPSSPSAHDEYQEIRDAAKTFALLLRKLVPYSRELHFARTRLEECVYYANSGIARAPTRHTEVSSLTPVADAIDKVVEPPVTATRRPAGAFDQAIKQ